MLSAFQTIFGFLDPQSQALQDNVAAALQPVLNVPFLDGVLIQSVSVNTTSPTLVPHGLGRAWVGWFVVDQTQGVMIWRPTSVTVPTSILPLMGNATTTINLWVF